MNARRAAVLIIVVPVAALLLATPACDLVNSLFGPPAVELGEEYEKGEKGQEEARFDHSGFAPVLQRFLTEDGLVDYASLSKDTKALDAYVAALRKAPWEQLGRDEKLTLLINAYNAFTLRLITDYWPVASIRDIPSNKRWADARWKIGPLTLSLDRIEHEYLRPKFKEPRIHFAVNCASIGCPPLAAEPYDAARIDAQLQAQALRVHADPRWLRLDGDTVHLTRLYQWFSGDFEQVAGSALAFAARFSPELKARLDAGNEPSIEWIDYDWGINAKR